MHAHGAIVFAANLLHILLTVILCIVRQALSLDRTWFLEIGPSAVIRLDAKQLQDTLKA